MFIHTSNAQQYNEWYFGQAAGLSFNPGSATIPHALTDGSNSAYEGNASMCDSNGNILFYTNGVTVYNRTHQVMLNGNNMMGHQSAVQSSLIIPMPNNDSIYYIFTTDAIEDNFANGYRYSIVNMKHDGGKGEVVTKNSLLNASCTERLTAVRHANGIDVWIIGNEKNSNVFKAWLLTCNGLQLTPVVSITGVVMNQHVAMNLGTLKAGPDGKQICQTHFPDFDGLFPENFFQIFDFNNNTGILSNPKSISIPNTNYHECEFSPDSKLLYVTRVFDTLTDQFEPKLVPAAAVISSRISIPSATGFYGIQTGPDGKIYLNRFRPKLSVISNPNVKGVGCTLEIDKIDLGNANGALGLPSAINDGPIDPFNNFTYQIIDSCNGIVQFNGTTNMGGSLQWNWSFGDGGTSSLQNPQHTFNPAGQIYNVKLTVKSSTACGYVEKTKSIAASGASLKSDFDFVARCDSDYVRFINKSIIYPDSSVQFFWNFGDGNTSNEADPIHSYTVSGVFTVKLVLKTSTACLNDSTTKTLNLQQLVIQASPDMVIDAGQSVQLNVTGGGTGFKWSPPTWLSDPNIQNPIAKPGDNITYTVTVTNDAGCRAVDSVSIKVNPVDGIFVPTAFTPNNDGKNDIFKPTMSIHFTLLNFSVYNRWGQLLFSTAEKGVGWDGKFKGKEQNDGVYIWIVKAKDANGVLIESKGLVVLVR